MGTENMIQTGKRIGIIGLDTSHAPAFTKSFNPEDASPDDYGGYKIVAAYPYGSRTIESSYSRIPGYIEDVKKDGVEIVDSIAGLLAKVDAVLLCTNDGHPHLEQAIEVFKAGKRMFIDKPVAGSLSDAFAIFQAAEDLKQPVFSTSGMRYTTNMDDIVKNKIAGDVLGAETYGPAPIEPTHPDFFWYGIHGIEALFTMMGTGCHTVSRVHTPNTDVVVGIWDGNRTGTFRGRRSVGNIYVYGGNAFCQNDIKSMGEYIGGIALEREIVKYFQTGVAPVAPEVTLEIYTFMEAADESKRRGGAAVSMAEIKQKALT
jgi:predicted dehydrogenase